MIDAEVIADDIDADIARRDSRDAGNRSWDGI